MASQSNIMPVHMCFSWIYSIEVKNFSQTILIIAQYIYLALDVLAKYSTLFYKNSTLVVSECCAGGNLTTDMSEPHTGGRALALNSRDKEYMNNPTEPFFVVIRVYKR